MALFCVVEMSLFLQQHYEVRWRSKKIGYGNFYVEIGKHPSARFDTISP